MIYSKKLLRWRKKLNNLIRLIYYTLETLPVVGIVFRKIRDRVILELRIKLIQKCPDNNYLTRVPDAGKIIRSKQILHNGIRVKEGGYYGSDLSRLIRENRGVFEPQEERVFQEVLKHIDRDAVMIELGAYWGAYSMWFYKAIPGARCFLVEPSEENILVGKENFKENACHGEFINACIGDNEYFPKVTLDSVDSIAERYSLAKISILHADIQQAEYKMLLGALKSIANGCIDYFFISTHTNELHNKCLNFFRSCGYIICVDVNIDESYSYDGLIVACRKSPELFKDLEVSHNNCPIGITDLKNIRHQNVYLIRRIMQVSRNRYLLKLGLFRSLCKASLNGNLIHDRLQNLIYEPTTAIGRQLFFYGKYEEAEIESAASFITVSRPVILDVGSNIGRNAIRWAKIFPAGYVHCFEPSFITCANLERNIKINKLNNVVSHNLALSNFVGKSKFYECQDSAFSALVNTGRSSLVNRYEINVKTLDSVVEELGLKEVSFIKIDVEGSEREVLEGAMNTIGKYKPLLMVELSSKNLYKQPADIINYICKLGYTPYMCVDSIGAVAYTSYNKEHENYFFLSSL